MVEWWRFGGRGSSWVDLDQHKWDSDPRGLVGMDLGSDPHKWDSDHRELVWGHWCSWVAVVLLAMGRCESWVWWLWQKMDLI